MRIIFISIASLIFLFTSAMATELKVTSAYKYKSSLNKDERAAAEQELKEDAIKKYVNDKYKDNKSGYRDFKKVEDQIYQNIDDYVNILSYLVDENDKKNKTLNLTAKVEILDMELEFVIGDSSAISNSMPSEKSQIVIVTVAAKAKKLNVFKAKETNVTKNSSENYNAEISNVDSTGAEVTTISETENISQSGGSTEYKSSNIEFGPVKGLDEQLFARAAQVFNDNQFNPIDGAQLFDSRIVDEYVSGDSLSNETKNYIYKTVLNSNVPYLILSKLKVDSMSTDPATGMPMISLISISEVFKCEQFCVSVATVGPVRRQAIGNNENEAITNALMEAVATSSQQSVDMMNAKGIR